MAVCHAARRARCSSAHEFSGAEAGQKLLRTLQQLECWPVVVLPPLLLWELVRLLTGPHSTSALRSSQG